MVVVYVTLCTVLSTLMVPFVLLVRSVGAFCFMAAWMSARMSLTDMCAVKNVWDFYSVPVPFQYLGRWCSGTCFAPLVQLEGMGSCTKVQGLVVLLEFRSYAAAAAQASV